MERRGGPSVLKWPGRFSLGSGPASDKLQAPWSKRGHGTDCEAVRALVDTGLSLPLGRGLYRQRNPPAQALGSKTWVSGDLERQRQKLATHKYRMREKKHSTPRWPLLSPPAVPGHGDRHEAPKESDFWAKGASNSCPLLSCRPSDPQEKGNNESICYSLAILSCWLAGDSEMGLTFYVSC